MAELTVTSPNDALFVVDFNGANPAAPFAISGEVAYKGGKPELPGVMVGVRRGMLSGEVLVVEVPGVRQVRFQKQGAPIDGGVLAIPGLDGAIGAIGVQP